MNDMKTLVYNARMNEVVTSIKTTIDTLAKEGLSVEFGKIGNRTTYAFLHNEDYSKEIVGYTFLKNMNYMNEDIGKLKALQQAIARKKLISNE